MFDFEVVTVASLFAACVNLIFLPQKPNSNETLQLDTRDLMRLYLINATFLFKGRINLSTG